MAYDLGATVPLGITVKDSAGAPANASAVTLTITLPDGTTATPAVANPPSTVGLYGVDYPSTLAGRHAVRWTTTGPAGAYTDVFYVRSAVTNALASLNEVKKHLNMSLSDTTADDELRDAIDVACDVAEYYAGSMAPRSVTELHSGRAVSGLTLRRPPIMSITSVVENDVTLPPAGYSLSEEGVLYRVGGHYDMPWMPGRNNITVTYQAGMLTIPPMVLDSVKELVRINFRSQLGGDYSPFDQGDSVAGGQVKFGFFVPNKIVSLLQLNSGSIGIA